MIEMSAEGVKEIHEKLDTLIGVVNEVKVDTGKQEQHLESINGAIARHEKNFGKVNKVLVEHGKSISFAKGAVWVFGLISVMLGIIAVAPTLI